MPAATMPTDGRADAAFALLADPYRWISRTARRLQSDVFATRLALAPTICLTGAAAAAQFYDPRRFVRAGAAPEPLRATLFGTGGVQSLDGAAHHARKAMFLAMMTSGRIRELAALFAGELGAATRAWAARPRVELYDAVQPVLVRSVCRWAGVPLPHADVPRRTRQLVALFDDAATAGPGHLRARRARGALEAWLGRLIAEAQQGRLETGPGTALHAVATFRGVDGRPLSPQVAAVELLNVLRPTAAVAVYATFAAHALHAHPDVRARLRRGDAAYARAFVQEVRRHYPFFPAVVARVREDFEWRGLRFPRGTRTLLDLYGTDHDPRLWADPGAFRPERFLARADDAFDFVPQGGGSHADGHRCPGEWITLALLGVAVDALANRVEFAVPRQDLRVDFARLPALPRSGVVLARVRPAASMPRPAFDVAGADVPGAATGAGAAASPAAPRDAPARTAAAGRPVAGDAVPRPARGRYGAGAAQSAP